VAAHHTAHFPPGLAADLVAQTPPGQWPEMVIERAMQAFAALSREERGSLVSAYWWGAIRQGVWRKLRITEAAWQLARHCKAGAWSAEQTLVAACAWYVRQNW